MGLIPQLLPEGTKVYVEYSNGKRMYGTVVDVSSMPPGLKELHLDHSKVIWALWGNSTKPQYCSEATCKIEKLPEDILWD